MSVRSCFEYAMNYIYRYPKTQKELKVQLLKKGFTEDEANTVIDMLIEKKFIDDKQFAQLYVSSELVKKGKPLIVVKGKLLQKGVDKSIISEVLDNFGGEISDGIISKIIVEIKKLKSRGVEGFEIIQKLAQKGYKVDDIKSAVKSLESN